MNVLVLVFVGTRTPHAATMTSFVSGALGRTPEVRGDATLDEVMNGTASAEAT